MKYYFYDHSIVNLIGKKMSALGICQFKNITFYRPLNWIVNKKCLDLFNKICIDTKIITDLNYIIWTSKHTTYTDMIYVTIFNSVNFIRCSGNIDEGIKSCFLYYDTIYDKSQFYDMSLYHDIFNKYNFDECDKCMDSLKYNLCIFDNDIIHSTQYIHDIKNILTDINIIDVLCDIVWSYLSFEVNIENHEVES